MTKTKQEIQDKDFYGVDQALRRAALRARRIAAQTGTPLVIFRDGRIEHHFVSASETTGETSTRRDQAGDSKSP